MNQPRDHWGSRLGFIVAAAGGAIGLGNLWKFPYITFENEGGAFVIVYLFCILLVGLPIMIGELLIGRKTQRNAAGAYANAVGPHWVHAGRLGILTGFVILGYYTVIAGWSLYYVVKCIGWSASGYAPGTSSPDAFGAFVANGPMQVSLSILFMATTMTVILKGVGKGIEKLTRTLMPILIGILILMLFSALRMSGAGDALRFIFVPDLANFKASSALEALGHAFFTLSLGMGAMITYGSYMRRKDSVVSSALAVVILDTCIALLATIVMFCIIFSVPGLKDSIGRSTVGMLFITLPEQIYTALPAGRLLGPLFYSLVALAALTSTISMLEVIVSWLIDERGMSRAKATLSGGLGALVVSILCALSLGAMTGLSTFEIFSGKGGMLSTLDHLASNWLLPIGGFLLTIAVGWGMSKEDTYQELVDEHTPSWFNFAMWRFFVMVVAPICVGTIIGFVIFAGRDFS